MIIHLVAEGHMETIVAARLIPFCGHQQGTIYDQHGHVNIRKKAVKFHHLATEDSGVLVLTDFRDAKASCIKAALQEYVWNALPKPPKSFLCRFAVSELESWLLADREGLAKYLGVSVSRVPSQPEKEVFPKRVLVNLAGTSRKTRIRNGIASPPGHRADVGPDYMSLLQEFIVNYWNIDAAIRHAPSLERCVRRLRELPQG
jgi:hypothetical protein